MRLISLVPSWTETLLAAGVEVVGRTRFCIHPAPAVEAIPSVGGTKRVDWSRAAGLGADLIVMDEEENTREIAASAPLPYLASRIRAVEDVAPFLRRLARRVASPPLGAIAARWDAVAARPRREAAAGIAALPGVLEWLRRPAAGGETAPEIVYVIWRDPWMAVGPDTFVASVLTHLGYGAALRPRPGPGGPRYPEIDLADLDPRRTVLLFASEPYPFARRREALAQLGFAAALVDGEAYSWFGVRTLRFLEAATSAKL